MNYTKKKNYMQYVNRASTYYHSHHNINYLNDDESTTYGENDRAKTTVSLPL